MLVKGAPGHISPELTPIANTLGSMLTLSRRSISNRCRSQGLCYPGRLKGCRWNQRLYAGQSDQGMQPLSRDSSLFQIRRVVHLFFQGYGDFTTMWMDSSLIITIIATRGHFIFYAVSCYMGILLCLFIAIIYRYSFTFFLQHDTALDRLMRSRMGTYNHWLRIWIITNLPVVVWAVCFKNWYSQTNQILEKLRTLVLAFL